MKIDKHFKVHLEQEMKASWKINILYGGQNSMIEMQQALNSDPGSVRVYEPRSSKGNKTDLMFALFSLEAGGL